jgi:hypothetical protein
LISGSVIDVEDYDWALPSLTSVGDSSYFGGGILIWHIDEDVIARGLVDNSVNADATHRGVDLEEADGSQDIGRSYDPYSEPGSGTEWGYQQDFWYGGNLIPIYTNVFDKNSNPSSRTYTGASSLVTIRGFSKRSPRMTAIVDIGDSQVTRLQGFARTITLKSTVTPPSAGGSTLFLGVDGTILALKADGSSKTKDPTGLLFAKGGSFAVAATPFANNFILAGAQDSTLVILNTFGKSTDATIDSVSVTNVATGDRITTPAMFADLSIAPSIVVGTAHGAVFSYSYTGALQKKTVVSSSPITSLVQLPTASLSKPSELFFVCGGRLYGEQSSVALGDSSLPWIACGITSRAGNFIVLAQQGGQKVLAFSRDLSQKIFEISTNGGGISSVTAADLDGDGQKDIVLLAGDRLIALNRTGAYLSGFPVFPPGSSLFVGDPVIGDVNGDGQFEILACLTTGNLVAYDKEGRSVSGFPVQFAPAGGTNIAAFQTSGGNIGIAGLTKPVSVSGVTGTATLEALEFTKPYQAATIAWSQYLKDGRHSNYDETAGGTIAASSDFLPRSRVYNWPNPVYSSTTHIRYYTPEDAAISIMILDLAGTKIAELAANSRGGLDGEVEWDVTNIQSGVYLARVEAKGASRSEVVIIKIAVVK